MFNLLIDGALLLFVGAYASVFGRSDERIVAGTFILTSLTATIVGMLSGHATSDLTVVVLHVLALVGYTTVALRSERFWPLWVAGLQLGYLLSQVLTSRHLDAAPEAFSLEPRLWIYLIALILAIGTWRGARHRPGERQLLNWNLRGRLDSIETQGFAPMHSRGTGNTPTALCPIDGVADPDSPSQTPRWRADPHSGILDDGRPQPVEKWDRLVAGSETLRIEHRRGTAKDRRDDVPGRGNWSAVEHASLGTDGVRTDEPTAFRSCSKR